MSYYLAAESFNIDPKLVAPLPEVEHLEEELSHAYIQASSKERRHMAHSVEDFLRQLPKAELHLHSTAMANIFATAPLAWEISARTDKVLQNREANKKSLENLILEFLNPKPGDLKDYLIKYDLLKNYLIRDLEAIRYTSYMGAKQAFENGVRILEIRTSIKAGDYGDPRTKGLSDQITYSAFDELKARVDGFRLAEKESGERLKVFLIITFRRQDSTENSMALLNDVIRYRAKIQESYGRDYIIAVDIAGQEYLYKARQFEPVFRKARDHGLSVTAHAGEEPGSGEGSIWQAINSGAERIGHGTSLYLPTPMLSEAVRHEAKGLKKNSFILSLMFGTAYEMCLTSNLICGAEVTTGYQPNEDGRPIAVTRPFAQIEDYPAKYLLALGSLSYHGRSQILPIPCTDGIYTLNTDLAREYALAAQSFQLGLKEILALARYSIRHSFAPSDVKAEALQEWREFASVYLNDNRFSIVDEEVKRALHSCRLRVRKDLGIKPEIIEEILQEVHSSGHYLKDYLYDRFHDQNSELEV